MTRLSMCIKYNLDFNVDFMFIEMYLTASMYKTQSIFAEYCLIYIACMFMQPQMLVNPGINPKTCYSKDTRS